MGSDELFAITDNDDAEYKADECDRGRGDPDVEGPAGCFCPAGTVDEDGDCVAVFEEEGDGDGDEVEEDHEDDCGS